MIVNMKNCRRLVSRDDFVLNSDDEHFKRNFIEMSDEESEKVKRRWLY